MIFHQEHSAIIYTRFHRSCPWQKQYL